MSEKKITVLDVLQSEISQLMRKSEKYRKEYKYAKTLTKKRYLNKKLTKNNKDLAKMLLAAEKLTKKGATNVNEKTNQNISS